MGHITVAKYLITGGGGFIGSRLASVLAQDGHAVRVTDVRPPTPEAPQNAPIEFIQASIIDRAAMEQAFDGMDACFHLAGAPTDHDPRRDELGHGTDLAGYAEVLFSCAHRAGNIPVIYASSAAVYGAQPQGAIAETASCHPVNAHGEEKLLLEKAAQSAYETLGIPSTGLRFFNLYGPTQSPASMYCGAPRHFVERIRIGQPIVLHGDGSQVRDFTHIDDAVAGLVCAAPPADGARIFNICTGAGTSIRDLAEMVARAAKRELVLEMQPLQGPVEVDVSIGDPRLASEALGFTAKIPLVQGVEDMVARLL